MAGSKRYGRETTSSDGSTGTNTSVTTSFNQVIQAGTGTATSGAGTVVFPTVFNTVPVVVLTPGIQTAANMVLNVTAITVTGFSFSDLLGSTGVNDAGNIQWVAVGS